MARRYGGPRRSPPRSPYRPNPYNNNGGRPRPANINNRQEEERRRQDDRRRQDEEDWRREEERRREEDRRRADDRRRVEENQRRAEEERRRAEDRRRAEEEDRRRAERIRQEERDARERAAWEEEKRVRERAVEEARRREEDQGRDRWRHRPKMQGGASNSTATVSSSHGIQPQSVSGLPISNNYVSAQAVSRDPSASRNAPVTASVPSVGGVGQGSSSVPGTEQIHPTNTIPAGSSAPAPVVGVPADVNVGREIVDLQNTASEIAVCDGCGNNHNILVCQDRKPWEYVAPFFGSADFDQGFYSIPVVESELQSLEQLNYAHIKVVRGDVTGKELENEFQLWADSTNVRWRFTAKPVSAVEFLMRFPNAKAVDDLSHFGKFFMKTMPEAVLELKKWNGDIEPFAWLEEAWIRIGGIPLKFRYTSTAFYAAGLVGKPLAMDKNSLRNFAFIRVKVGCKDVTLIPNTRIGELKNGLFEFHYTRELFEPNANPTPAVGTQVLTSADNNNSNGDDVNPDVNNQLEMPRESDDQNRNGGGGTRPAQYNNLVNFFIPPPSGPPMCAAHEKGKDPAPEPSSTSVDSFADKIYRIVGGETVTGRGAGTLVINDSQVQVNNPTGHSAEQTEPLEDIHKEVIQAMAPQAICNGPQISPYLEIAC